MAIQLTYADEKYPDDSVLVPVAAAATYRDYWLPAAQRMHLPLISAFEPGLQLTGIDSRHLIEELDIVKTYWSRTLGNNPELRGHLIERATLLAHHLALMSEEGSWDAFIG